MCIRILQFQFAIKATQQIDKESMERTLIDALIKDEQSTSVYQFFDGAHTKIVWNFFLFCYFQVYRNAVADVHHLYKNPAAHVSRKKN
jgi:hypothetical protein